MNILIVHPSFPGQYFYLCRYLGANPENKVYFLAKSNSIGVDLPGVVTALYKEEDQIPEDTPAELKNAAEAVAVGKQTVRALISLKDKGFIPDVIIGHTGWGSLLFTKDVFPDVPVIGYVEWYYKSKGSDSYYWPGEVAPLGDAMYIRSKNMQLLVSMEACDICVSPTKWQKSQFPKFLQDKIVVQHEGTDTEFCCPPPPGPKPAINLPEINFSLPQGTEIISYVSRGLEPIRGFDKFMDAMRIVLKARPNCHVVIAGADRICYSAALPDGKTCRTLEEEKGGYDKDRVHFVGSLNRRDYKNMLQASCCHVYLTRPFILSWSMLEVMSFGLPLVASATPPVMEVVEDGVNGVLAEFRSPKHIADKVIELLNNREYAEKLGKAARETILERFELNKTQLSYQDLMYKVLR